MVEPTERDKEKLGNLGFFFPFSLRQSSSAGPWSSLPPGHEHDPLTLGAMTHSTEYSRRRTAYHVLGSTELSLLPLLPVMMLQRRRRRSLACRHLRYSDCVLELG